MKYCTKIYESNISRVFKLGKIYTNIDGTIRSTVTT